MSAANILVWCLLCIDDGGEGGERVHVFSSKEKALEFAENDPRERRHILYDYVIDCPERMEGAPT